MGILYEIVCGRNDLQDIAAEQAIEVKKTGNDAGNESGGSVRSSGSVPERLGSRPDDRS